MQTIKDIMSPGVRHIPDDLTLAEAADQMAAHDIGLLAVSNGQQASGVITDRDIVLRCLASGKDPFATKVGECMSPDVATLSETEPITTAAEVMKEKRIRRILVQNSEGQLTGVLSLGDLGKNCDVEGLSQQVLEKVAEPVAAC